MSKSCLVIIDMQNGILKYKNGILNSEIISSNIISCMRFSVKENIKIVITQHENKSYLLKNTEEWKIIDPIQDISNNAYILEKKHPSIYKETNLEKILIEYDIDTLYFCGLVSNGCVKAACIESKQKGFTSYLINDAHSTFYKNAKSIIYNINKEMQDKGIKLISTKSFTNNTINSKSNIIF